MKKETNPRVVETTSGARFDVREDLLMTTMTATMMVMVEADEVVALVAAVLRETEKDLTIPLRPC